MESLYVIIVGAGRFRVSHLLQVPIYAVTVTDSSDTTLSPNAVSNGLNRIVRCRMPIRSIPIRSIILFPELLRANDILRRCIPRVKILNMSYSWGMLC